jgi:hypothetical protein
LEKNDERKKQMKTITKILYVTLAPLSFLCFALSPMAQAQLELPPPNANLFASINSAISFQEQNFIGKIYQYTPTGVLRTPTVGLSRPRGLAFDSLGNFFVANTYFGTTSVQSTILKFSRGIQRTFAATRR